MSEYCSILHMGGYCSGLYRNGDSDVAVNLPGLHESLDPPLEFGLVRLLCELVSTINTVRNTCKKLTLSQVFAMLGRATLSAMYLRIRANCGEASASRAWLAASSLIVGGLESRICPRRMRIGITAASAMDHAPTAKPSAGSIRCRPSMTPRRPSTGTPRPKMKPAKAGTSFVSVYCVKRRALARRAGSVGRRPALGNMSARNSLITSDSGTWTESGDGASPGLSLGPP